MDLTNIEVIKKILKKNNLVAEKKFGQNFLTNKKVLDSIISAADVQKNDHIIEIGPGLGCLTYELAKRAKKITTIELDANLIPILKNFLVKFDNIEILNEDALKSSLPEHPYKVVANIPYNITSPLINHFIKDIFMLSRSCHFERGEAKPRNLPGPLSPSLLVLLIQKEVAEKICTVDGKLNVIALNIQTFADCEIIAEVPKNNFFPEPKVDSAVIKIKVHAQPKVQCDLKKYFQIINAAFAQKRKKIKNSLSPLMESWNLNPDSIFIKSNINPDQRPEDLKIANFEKLTDFM